MLAIGSIGAMGPIGAIGHIGAMGSIGAQVGPAPLSLGTIWHAPSVNHAWRKSPEARRPVTRMLQETYAAGLNSGIADALARLGLPSGPHAQLTLRVRDSAVQCSTVPYSAVQYSTSDDQRKTPY
eukprot:8539069-Pyramimonas_sp.AAC.1